MRTTAIATIVVGLVLGAVLYALAQQTRVRLEGTITSSAEARAADLAGLVEAGGVSNVLPGGSRDLFAQVVAEDGVVIASSPGLAGLDRFIGNTPEPGEVFDVDVENIFQRAGNNEDVQDEGPYRVIAQGVTSPAGLVTVLVAASLEPSQQALGALTPLLAFGFPVLLVTVGVTVWMLTGRALRPVDAMRREAEVISAQELRRRLPVPATRDEIARLAETLNAMLSRLEGAVERQRQFVADASHELKSPIWAIRTMLDVAEADPTFDDWNGLMTDLRRHDERLEQVVGDLLTLARWEDGLPPDKVAEIDLDQLIGRQAELAARTKDIDLHTGHLAPIRVNGSRRALETLFRNLLENAVREATSAAWVRSRTSHGTAIVTVSDDGPGIPPDSWERVFERFVRLDEARHRSEGGAGLGLAVSRAIARGHDGTIQFVTPEHEGASVQVTLRILPPVSPLLAEQRDSSGPRSKR